ncbi:hard surface induced protein [Niveomyces insectorum RCEF 264]|uniref:Hard surface induced protein n=1 Tax=Niveomyces insectorum RCEF 264 TaxID=1081102 RepID=A0A168A490_9HYPO|nr:hard surface induced protein [Niveomyces insectorum RCEF 264]
MNSRSRIALPGDSPAVRALRALLPSFVATVVWPEPPQQQQPRRLAVGGRRPTAYLDGLRGVASAVVFVCHYTEQRHDYFTPTYGLNDAFDGSRSAFLQLPYVRLVYSGRPMVHIFFVISGFVLAYRPLQLLHASSGGHGQDEGGGGGDTAALGRVCGALASSTFRRPIRLLLPCVVSTLAVAALTQTGWFVFSFTPPAEASVAAELRHWCGNFVHAIAWPWAWDHDLRPHYDVHLWTIPIELAHSLLLFLVLLALVRLRTRLRRALNALLVVYCMAVGKWAASEFLAGLFLAERHILKEQRSPNEEEEEDDEVKEVKEEEENKEDTRAEVGPGGRGHACVTSRMMGQHTVSRACVVRTHRLAAARRVGLLALHGALLLVALYVDGWPNNDADRTPGIRYLLAHTPAPFLTGGNELAQKFWFSLAAVAVVWSCGEVPALRRRFEGPVAQYCGRISYALYLVHGPGLDCFQDWVLGRPATPAHGSLFAHDFVPATAGTGIKGMVGVAGPTQRVVAWLAGLLVLGPVIVWLADLFWRAVDAPVVRLGRAVERACLAPPAHSLAERAAASAKEQSRGDGRGNEYAIAA